MGKRIREFFWQCDASFADHDKHSRLADLVGVSINEAVGIVTALFCRVRRLKNDGDVSGVPDSALQRWTHNRKVTRVALIESGWLDADGKVHEWDERYGEKAISRAKERDKKGTQRGQMRDTAGTNEGQTGDSPSRVRPRDESESESDNENDELMSMPDGMDVAAPAATPPPDPRPRQLLERWNALAAELGLPQAETLSEERRKHAKQRVRDGILERWDEFAAALRGPAGKWHRDKGVGIDWLLRPGKALALIERATAARDTPRGADACLEIPFDR